MILSSIQYHTFASSYAQLNMSKVPPRVRVRRDWWIRSRRRIRYRGKCRPRWGYDCTFSSYHTRNFMEKHIKTLAHHNPEFIFIYEISPHWHDDYIYDLEFYDAIRLQLLWGTLHYTSTVKQVKHIMNLWKIDRLMDWLSLSLYPSLSPSLSLSLSLSSLSLQS